MAQKHAFQTEITQLLDLMIHSLYSNKEIFLRELISNASDALDKLSYLSVSDEKFKNLKFEPRIDISFDEKKGTLSIADSGIGMDENELKEHLGVIAKSGTKSFLSQLSGDKKKDSALIGQFGVGFYSAFMVAKQVVVQSRRADCDKAFAWVSEGKGEYEIGECIKDEHGTQITLYLNDESKNFASRWEIEEIVKKYSEHIAFPIFLHYEVQESVEDDADSKKDDSKKTKTKKVQKVEQINSAQALWTLNKSELKADDYNEFYKAFAGDNANPLKYIHTKVEGTQEYTTLFFIPSKAPFDLYRVDYKSGVRLYVKRVFITDDDKELLPPYLRFVRGVIDSSDLPLNVSREILQQNKILANIKSASTKKILGEIANLSKDESAYKGFFEQFGKVLKEGLYSDYENKDKILSLLRFNTQKREFVSLASYKAQITDSQKSIYYALGENIELLKSNALLEKFNAKGYEVLLLSDEVDGVVMPMAGEFEGLSFKNISSKEALDEIGDDSISDSVKDEFKAVVEGFKNALKERVGSVGLTGLMSDSALGIIQKDENPMMAQLFAQMGQAAPKSVPDVELNVNHQIMQKLKSADSEKIAQVARLLFDATIVCNGQILDAKSDFKNELNSVILENLSK